jgi:hypothetical protein
VVCFQGLHSLHLCGLIQQNANYPPLHTKSVLLGKQLTVEPPFDHVGVPSLILWFGIFGEHFKVVSIWFSAS